MTDNARAKAKRVRCARMLAGLTRKQLYSKYNIHENTVKSWENPPEGKQGLTLKGAQRFTQALKNENVLCSPDWLLTGAGSGPKLSDVKLPLFDESDLPDIELNQNLAILKEMQFFTDINPNSTCVTVTNNFMLPYYHVGDIVGGYKHPSTDADKFINSNCIIETDEHIQYVCRYNRATQENKHQLFYLNSPAMEEDQLLSRPVEIISVAPIVWHRKKEPNIA